VIMPTYNRKEKLNEAINSILCQTYDDRYEFIIVDDGSDDGTEDLVKNIQKSTNIELKYLKQKHAGPAKARNLGIKNSAGDLILFLGDDMIADKNLIREHVSFHKNRPKIACLGFTKLRPNLMSIPLMRYTFEKCYGPQIDPDNIQYNLQNLPFVFFMTANISVPKEYILQTGMFDEDFNCACIEDIELGYRLQSTGLRITFNKNAVAYHNHTLTLEEFCELCRLRGKNLHILKKKHPSTKVNMPDELIEKTTLDIPDIENKEFNNIISKKILNSGLTPHILKILIPIIEPIVQKNPRDKNKRDLLYSCYSTLDIYYFVLGMKEFYAQK